MKRKICIALKYALPVFACIGIVLGMVYYREDGYSHPAKRLLYFTTQSNLWIAFTSVALLILPRTRFFKKEKVVAALFLLKFIFTVSIAVTGVVFCTLLAPFADENYRPWTFYSLCTHVIVPSLALIDYFLDDMPVLLSRQRVCYSVLPPLAYFLFSIILGAANVDFGRGDPFPYFFLDFHSEVGLFGVKLTPLPALGTVYWIVILSGFILGLGACFASLHPRQKQLKKQRSSTAGALSPIEGNCPSVQDSNE